MPVIPYRAEAGITVVGTRGVVAYLSPSVTIREAHAMCDTVNGGAQASAVFPAYSRPPYTTAAKIDARAAA